jgi:hypothetical protein
MDFLIYLGDVLRRLESERGWFDTDHPKDQATLNRIDSAIQAIQDVIFQALKKTSERGSS